MTSGQTLTGTTKAEALIGGEGDDTFRNVGGGDYVHGKGGIDTIELQGKPTDYKIVVDMMPDGPMLNILIRATGDTIPTVRSIERIRFMSTGQVCKWDSWLGGLTYDVPAAGAPAIDTAKIADLLSQAQKLLGR
jgi:Ca2+-binding RTX toxin-like protein